MNGSVVQSQTDCSVPPGSVLGPLKFVAYAEDLPSVIKKHELDHHLYADDTQITDHLQLKQAAAAITNIERCGESVRVWCTYNACSSTLPNRR